MSVFEISNYQCWYYDTIRFFTACICGATLPSGTISARCKSPYIYRGLHRALKMQPRVSVSIVESRDLVIVRFRSIFGPETTQASVVEAVSMSALKILSSGYNSATEKNRAVYTVMAQDVMEKVHFPLLPLEGFNRASESKSIKPSTSQVIVVKSRFYSDFSFVYT